MALQRILPITAVACLALTAFFAAAEISRAQEAETQPPAAAAAVPAAPEKDLAAERFDAAMKAPPAEKPERVPAKEVPGIDLLEMASPRVGGIFMYPIYFFSFVVVLFGIERWIGLRRSKVLPRKLAREVNAMIEGSAGFDPRKVWRLCQRYPSSAANVLKAALLRTGRPMAEIEEAVTKAEEREATRLYANVRPLNLAATVAPLLGLAGTVQGLIITFYVTAHLPDGVNKAQALAGGVYIKLVTTFAGLCVAIVAVCLAHYFEGKIQRLFSKVEELTANLLPVLERYEGKLRITRGPVVAHAGNDPSLESEPVHKTAASSE